MITSRGLEYLPEPGLSPCSNWNTSRCLFAALAAVIFLLVFGAGGPALAQRPLGIDVSAIQGSGIDWATVKASGISFAWVKATEGTGYIDANFVEDETGAVAAGVLIGAYHFARYDLGLSAVNEANYFWNEAEPYIKTGGVYLEPMLDVEVTNTLNMSQAEISDWVNTWCQTVVNDAASVGVTVKPVIYTYPYYAATYLNNSVTQWPLWMATITPPQNPQTGGPALTPWSTWAVWQWSWTSTVPGVPVEVDEDVFNGTLNTMIQTLVIGGTNAPNITAGPTNVGVYPGGKASFTVQASGQGPLSYYWRFDGAVIPGATSTSYTVTNAQLANAGGYSVLVSNAYATIVGGPAFLSVFAPLTNGNGCVLAPAGMTSWWPAEGNGKDIYGTNNATPQSGLAYGSGKEGMAFQLDGATSYLTTKGPTLRAPWTVCCWVMSQNSSGNPAAIIGDGTNELKLEQYNTARQVGVTQLGLADMHYNYSVPLNTWTHLAFVDNGSSIAFYANGVNQGSLYNNSGTATNVSVPAPRTYLGCGFDAQSGNRLDYLLGRLDETMIFTTALTAAQISTLYAAGSGGLYRVPVFTNIFYTSGQPVFTVNGQTGKNFTFYSSPDLVNWTELRVVSGTTGTATYGDWLATGPQMFYRVAQTLP